MHGQKNIKLIYILIINIYKTNANSRQLTCNSPQWTDPPTVACIWVQDKDILYENALIPVVQNLGNLPREPQ